jgi:hypothetical protein
MEASPSSQASLGGAKAWHALYEAIEGIWVEQVVSPSTHRALGSRHHQLETAHDLGWSVPRLHLEALRLAADPDAAGFAPVERGTTSAGVSVRR